MRRAFVFVFIMLTVTAATAVEHWMTADPPHPSPGDEVTLDMRLGEPWRGEQRFYDPTTTTQFQHVWRAGRENLTGVPGEPPLGRFTAADRPGVELIVHAAHSPKSAHSLRFSKAIVVVGDAPEGGELHLSEVGQRLEIVPQTDPVTTFRHGGPVQVQVLWEREPLAGAGVFAFPESAPQEGFTRARADEIGLATLRLDRAGRWLIGVAHKAPCIDCGDVDIVRAHASLTLVVGPDRGR